MCLAFIVALLPWWLFLVRFQAIPVYLNVANDDWVLDFFHCNAVNMDFFIRILHSVASGEPIRLL